MWKFKTLWQHNIVQPASRYHTYFPWTGDNFEFASIKFAVHCLTCNIHLATQGSSATRDPARKCWYPCPVDYYVVPSDDFFQKGELPIKAHRLHVGEVCPNICHLYFVYRQWLAFFAFQSCKYRLTPIWLINRDLTETLHISAHVQNNSPSLMVCRWQSQRSVPRKNVGHLRPINSYRSSIVSNDKPPISTVAAPALGIFYIRQGIWFCRLGSP
jgi:hypothetical protein